MGQKVNPIGLRLGIHRKWNSNWFFDFTNYSKFLYTHFDIEKFFRGFLYYYPIKTLLINCQIIKLPSNKLYIFVFFYRLRKKKKKSIKKNMIKPLSYTIKKNSLNNDYNKVITKNFINKNNNLSYLNLNRLYNAVRLNENVNYASFIDIEHKNIFKNLNIVINNLNKIKLLKNKINSNLYNKIISLYLKKIEIIKLKSLKLNTLINLLILFNKKQSLNTEIEELKEDFYKKRELLINYRKFNHKLNLSIKKFNRIKNKINYKKNIYNINVYLYIFNKNNKNVKNKYINILLCNLILINNQKIKNNNFQNYISIKKYKKDNHIKRVKINNLKKKVFFNKNAHFKLQHIKKFLSRLTNLKTSIFFVNSLSFIKFYYYLEQNNNKVKKDPNILLSIQQQMLSTYRYNAIYIQDFVNIAFISMILKNPKFLTQFIAFQFKKLPKNKRQLKLIQLITKTIQIIGKERKEISGLKIKFKGRINKKKRARSINFKEGIITLQTHSSRVEYGYSNAYTKSGSLGIKLWIFYNKNFKNELKQNFLQYIKYSNLKNRN